MEWFDLIKPYVDLVNDPTFYFLFIGANLIAFLCWINTLITDNLSQVIV
jgi:hypothetical protein